MDKFVKLVCVVFAGDPTAPSVILSWLEEKQTWYCSVRRYSGAFAQGSVVVCSATGASLSDAASECRRRFLSVMELDNETFGSDAADSGAAAHV